MKALRRKLLRDLWQLRTQVVTVALVVASAVSGFAGSLGTYLTLIEARDSFYASARFGDVFGELKRAPLAVETTLAALPGVAAAQTTVVFDAVLDLPGVEEPTIGRVIGLPQDGPQKLDQLVLLRGSMPAEASTAEAVVSEGFAAARNLAPGDSVVALLNGKRTTLRIVGVGVSPDYIYASRGGAFPDDRSFGVFWMARERLASAYDMEGAFNHVSLRLSADASPRATMAAVDRILEPFGGMQAYGRDDQLSHRILAQEIDQWRVTGTLIPSLFLGVSAFLLNVVLSRQVATQREQIAALKALGYSNGAVASHYLQQVAVVLVLGTLLGLGVGYWFGNAVSALYARFFHFPAYHFTLAPWVMLVSTLVTAVAAIAGAWGAVRKAVSLAPAEAMRPPYPGRYRPTLLERAGLGVLLSPVLRMTLRTMERRPWRAALTALGIAASMGIIICGTFWRDALNYMIDVEFERAQRADAEITLTEPQAARALYEVTRMTGVLMAEGARSAPVRLVAGHREYRTALLGIEAGARLRRLLAADGSTITLPPDGIVVSERLAERLGVAVGDALEVQALGGRRARADVRIAATVHDLIGLSAYMDITALNRLLGEGDVRTSFAVKLDSPDSAALYAHVKTLPRVATVASKTVMLATFRETSARNVLFFTSVLTAFAAVIAIGVVYNHARIALQERAWELASLRVLGFTRAEVSAFLLGELAFETFLAVPIGCLLGYALSWAILHLSRHDMIDIPIVIAPQTYGFAALAIVLAAVASGLIVRRRIDGLDLVGVLKTRE